MHENMDVAATLKDAIGSVIEEARKAPPVPNTNTQHIVMHSADPPKPEPRMAWLAATAAVISVLVASGAVWVASDAKAEVRALRLEMRQELNAAKASHDDDTRELRQADRSFMAYINTGRMPTLSKESKKD